MFAVAKLAHRRVECPNDFESNYPVGFAAGQEEMGLATICAIAFGDLKGEAPLPGAFPIYPYVAGRVLLQFGNGAVAGCVWTH